VAVSDTAGLAPRAAGEHAEITAAAIKTAEDAGILPCGGVYGQIVMPDAGNGMCCDGAAVMGPQYCTCWERVYDLEQQPPAPDVPAARGTMCADCAYRPGSPERSGDTRYTGDQDTLNGIVRTGQAFFCHQGMRRIVALVHPSGARVDVGEAHPGAYDPPIEDSQPYKADGTPGDLGGGWTARRVHHLTQEAMAAP
jgi:hypothetical protein